MLHREMAAVQNGILALAARGQGPLHNEGPAEGSAVVAADPVRAFTRADRHLPDRLVREALPPDLLNGPWHRRRRSGPVDSATLRMDEWHLLLETAAVCVRPPALRQAFRRTPAGGRRYYLATLRRRLRDADRADLSERRRRWPKTA